MQVALSALKEQHFVMRQIPRPDEGGRVRRTKFLHSLREAYLLMNRGGPQLC